MPEVTEAFIIEHGEYKQKVEQLTASNEELAAKLVELEQRQDFQRDVNRWNDEAFDRLRADHDEIKLLLDEILAIAEDIDPAGAGGDPGAGAGGDQGGGEGGQGGEGDDTKLKPRGEHQAAAKGGRGGFLRHITGM